MADRTLGWRNAILMQSIKARFCPRERISPYGEWKGFIIPIRQSQTRQADFADEAPLTVKGIA
jgi:hypothetical protein